MKTRAKRQATNNTFAYAVLFGICLIALLAIVSTTRQYDVPAVMPTENAVGQAFIDPNAPVTICGTTVYLDGPVGHKELYSRTGTTSPIKISGPLQPDGQVYLFAVTPDGTRVVYAASKKEPAVPGNVQLSIGELFVVPITGGEVTQLTEPMDGGRAVTKFQISPDNQRVAYVANLRDDTVASPLFELFSVPITGGPSTRLSHHLPPDHDVAAIRFSPNSQRIVYLAGWTSNGKWELYSVPSAGGTSRRISQQWLPTTRISARLETWRSISFTCDSQTVHYFADVMGSEEDQHYATPIDGGPITPLPGTQLPDFNCPVDPPTCTLAPSCGNTGSSCITNTDCCSNTCNSGVCATTTCATTTPPRVFVDDRDTPGQSEIYAEDMTTGVITKISGPLQPGGRADYFQLTPDNQHVVYRTMSPPVPPNRHWTHDLFVASVNGGEVIRINGQAPGVHYGQGIYFFAISPDGARVAYLSNFRGVVDATPVSELFSVPITGGASVRLSHTLPGDHDVDFIRFSPDSQHIIYTVSRAATGESDLYSVPSEGGRVVGISHTGQERVWTGPPKRTIPITNRPTVSCDSQTVYYLSDGESGTGRYEHTFSVPIDGGAITPLPGTQLPDFNCPAPTPPTCIPTTPACQDLDTACDDDANCCSGICSEGWCALTDVECENDNWCSLNERCESGTCVPTPIATAQFNEETATCAAGFNPFFCRTPITYTSDGAGYVQLWREGGTPYDCTPAGATVTKNVIATRQTRTYALYAATDCEPENADKRVALDTIHVRDDTTTPDPIDDQIPPPATCDDGQHLNEEGTCAPDTIIIANPPRIFVDDRDTPRKYELYSEDIATGVVTKLSTPPQTVASSVEFKVTPDGTRVIYLATTQTAHYEGTTFVNPNYELFTVPTTGGQITKLNAPLQPKGSVSLFDVTPDGRNVGYVADAHIDGREDLFIAPITGGNPIKISQHITDSGRVTRFRFTPDSKHVVYPAILTSAPNEEAFFDLFVAPITGGTVTKLNTPPFEIRQILVVEISPDGSHVAYTATPLKVVGGYSLRFEIYIVPITGGTVKKISHPIVPGYAVHDMLFSPDSQRIVYRVVRVEIGKSELYSVPSAGGRAVRISKADEPPEFPSVKRGYKVSCDSQTVYYTADARGTRDDDALSVPINGGPITQLPGPQLPVLDCNA